MKELIKVIYILAAIILGISLAYKLYIMSYNGVNPFQ